jgi:cell wall-associated NlpC family hydrolase
MPAISRRQRLFALPVLLVLTLVATLFVAGPAEASLRRERKIANAVEVALKQLGDPYVYGAAGPNAFDCSGLTMYSFAKVGISLQRSADAQYRAVRHISKQQLRRGDLVYFHDSSGRIYHAGIFLRWKDGERIILHAPNSGSVVRRDPIWTGSWYAGTKRAR